MSKETNKQAADKLFASTAHDVLYANPKGEFFTSQNIGELSLKVGQKLEKFTRTQKVSDDSADEKVYDANAKDTIAKIKASLSIEDLKAFESDDRKSVIEALAKKHAEIAAEIEVNTSDATDGNKGTEDQK